MPHRFGAGPNLELWSQELDDRAEVICALDADLRITWCNRAWDQFALANAGPEARRANIIGQPVLAAIAPVLRPYFENVYNHVFRRRQPFAMEYECSSPSQFRIFQMRVLPLADGQHLLVVHSLMVERPHDPGVDENSALYLHPDGALHLCAHCRRARRADNSQWDWVPAFLEHPPAPISHGLCPLCLAYFYPDHWQNLRHKRQLKR